MELHYQDAKTYNNDSYGPKYKTLKAGYLYAQQLADKYNQQHLSVLGGVENFLALVANIVSNTEITNVSTLKPL